METITIKTGVESSFLHVDNSFDCCKEIAPDGWMEAFTEKQRDALRSVDDWESFEYYIINGSSVMMTDGYSILRIFSVDEFLDETRAWILEEYPY